MSRRVKKAPTHHATPRVIVGVEDMILLQDTRDSGIASNLTTRLASKQIYTYIGNVLVVCNPFTWLPIYDEDFIHQYDRQARFDVPPHIYAIAESAFRNLVMESENQAIIISGESGAGKTEASKHIQNYIAKISGGGESVETIKSVFLSSNPVLEAFGNAKTLRNNNSSRFGKYFELKFDRYGAPKGGVIINYLLEKSRICRPSMNERNFHIFYQLLSSPYANALHLSNSSQYNYLLVSKCDRIDGVNDSTEFEKTLTAMRAVGMKNNLIQSIFTLVGAILHLGNVKFKDNHKNGVEGSVLESIEPLKEFCKLLLIHDVDGFLKVLTHRTLTTMAPGGKVDQYEVPQNSVQSSARRDSIAKSLYEKLFDLIVSRINVALSPAHINGTDKPSDLLSIGVLDIYGFEVFQNNGFEQLCINYVNEKLQQIFIELTLRSEQEEYEKEGIAWEAIPFFNNKVVCELLDGSRPPGLFRILDDSCKAFHGTKEGMEVDRKFLETCSQVNGNHPHFRQSSSSFTIKHYAGDVSYSIGKFAESNRDSLHPDLIKFLQDNSGDKLVRFLYENETDGSSDKRMLLLPSSGSRIRTQCQDLVSTLMDCTPHYVRCIKSNDSLQPLHSDTARVTHQVKYLGLSENVKVRRAGFAYRAEYHRFFDRFSILSPETYPDWHGNVKEGCRRIVSKLIRDNIIEGNQVQFGSTKIFVRKPETYFDIEKRREWRMGSFASVIQRCWRKYANSRIFVSLQRNLAKLYLQEKKIRRRDSITRPFLGDYLDYIGKDSDSIRDEIYRIIDYYDESETIVFADSDCHRIVSLNSLHYPMESNNDSGCVNEKLTIVLTNASIYLFEIVDESKWNMIKKYQSLNPLKPRPCSIILRRRLPFLLKSATNSVVEGIGLSVLADAFLILSSSPQSVLAAPEKSHWLPDNECLSCPLTKINFGFFVRKHHCRLCGGIFSDSACDYRQYLPDLGWYTAERICDTCIGLSSSDILEDFLLYTPRRSELVALLLQQYQKVNVNGTSLSLSFSNKLTLKPSSIQSLSRNPCNFLEFVEDTNCSSSEYIDAKVLLNSAVAVLMIKAPSGLSWQLVEERRKQQLQRQQEAELRRKAREEERRQLRLQREEQIENERLIRLQEKRQKKLEDKEKALLAQQQQELEQQRKAVKKVSAAKKVPSQTPAIANSGAGSELAAALARRKKTQDS